MRHIGGGAYEQTFDPDGRPADCWVFEDLVYIHKRHVAAVGFSRDEMTMTPMTYDEMRPGCYEVKARVDDMLMNHVDASLCFPTFPRFCGQTFTEAKDRELGLACVQAYNDWMIEEWCGDSGGHLIPLCIVPLWDADLAAAEVRRNAARGCHAVCFSEIPPHLGLPSIHSGYWDPFFAGLPGHEHRGEHAHRLVVADAGDLARRAGRRRREPQLQQLDGEPVPTSCSPACSCGSRRSRSRTARARSAGCPTSSSGSTTCGASTGRGAAWRTSSPSRRRPTTTGRCSAASSVTTTASRACTGSASTTSPSRPTIPTPTPRGPTRCEVATAMMGHLPPDVQYKILRGNAIRMLGLGIR